jgi:hypothetical protein
VLWLTALVAMGAGWYCDRVYQQREQVRQAKALDKIVGSYEASAAYARERETEIRLAYDSKFGRLRPGSTLQKASPDQD